MANNCPICKIEAEVNRLAAGTEGYRIVCKRCGVFIVSGTLFNSDLSRITEPYLLSGVVRNLYERKNRVSITSSDIKKLIESFPTPKDPFQQIDLLLEYVYLKAQKITNIVELNQGDDYPIVFAEDYKEFNSFIKMTMELGYLQKNATGNNYKLTLKGWQKANELKKGITTNQAFVAMWFDSENDNAWKYGFEPALTESGYNPIRIDLVEFNDKICDRILVEIKKSSLIVADFTGLRGGVYFEAGYALGLGIPVIWTCNTSDINDLHFDTRQYNHIVWDEPDDLKQKILDRIEATR